jgi:hypothetical protein
MAAAVARSIDARVYRATLRLCPGEFRRDHADEMACDFEDARGEAVDGGARALWTLRVVLGVDLARTIVVQWLRTGLPVIACVAGAVTFTTAAGVAAVTRRITARAATAVVDEEAVAFILLSAIALMVIVATIVFNLWVHRSRLVRRR